jgi:hypothetical protein
MQDSAIVKAFYAPIDLNGTDYIDNVARAFFVLYQTNTYPVARTYVLDLPETPPYTAEQVEYARYRMGLFSQALGALYARKVDSVDNMYDLQRMAEKLMLRLYARSSATRYYHEARDELDVQVDHDYGGLRVALNRSFKNSITMALSLACDRADAGMMLAVYQITFGKLRTHEIEYERTSLRDLQSAISDMLAYSDDNEVMDYLKEHEFNECPDCSEWMHEYHSHRTYSDDNVCRACIDNNYEYSSYHDCYIYYDDRCGALDRHGDEITIHRDAADGRHFEWDDDEERYVHVEYARRSNVLRRYHSAKNNHDYRPVPSAWAEQSKRFFGVELEVECKTGRPHEHADNLNAALNNGNVGERCFFEEDGSLSHGFEIITQPMGLDSHYQFWEWLTKKELTTGLRSHDTSTCGLHIHVNRDGINTMQINKMCVFIHAPDNRNLVKAVARRYAVSYAAIHPKKLGTAHRSDSSDPRYEAVNLTNRYTIEMRMFKGTLKHQSVLAALEFTNALIRFTEPASSAGFILTADKFVDYINSSDVRRDTRNLRDYLKNVGFTS